MNNSNINNNNNHHNNSFIKSLGYVRVLIIKLKLTLTRRAQFFPVHKIERKNKSIQRFAREVFSQKQKKTGNKTSKEGERD